MSHQTRIKWARRFEHNALTQDLGLDPREDSSPAAAKRRAGAQGQRLQHKAAIAFAAMLIGAGSVQAHTIVGNRVFPATLTIDDPGVNDELALPTFAYMTAANPDGTTGPISYTLGWEYAKTITADLGVSIGSAGFSWQRNPKAEGWANIETQLKYVFYQNPEHEFIFAGAINFDWANTGSPQSASLPSAPFTTFTTKLYVGKGFGDAAADWLRPIAITGEADYNIPTTSINGDGSLNANRLTYGATLQYSLLYMNSFVHEVPDLFKRLIPAFEVQVATPVSNIGPSVAGSFSPSDTTGIFGPSLYYIGQYFEIGVMAQFPINEASGKHVGARAVVDFFLDDIFPDTIGRPLFGPPQPRTARY
ncbi:MAG TPA: hypothetical protein VEQ35_00590 [Beijerinckia sp.]|nr:hypothetical protein [Beijerinckia sp.]